jgi:hypothetical protein
VTERHLSDARCTELDDDVGHTALVDAGATPRCRLQVDASGYRLTDGG